MKRRLTPGRIAIVGVLLALTAAACSPGKSTPSGTSSPSASVTRTVSVPSISPIPQKITLPGKVPGHDVTAFQVIVRDRVAPVFGHAYTASQIPGAYVHAGIVIVTCRSGVEGRFLRVLGGKFNGKYIQRSHADDSGLVIPSC